jgi:uncharacterized membrane protein YfcA
MADPHFWLLVLTSFVASAISGAFAIGGGFLMLAVVAAFMPVSAVVPLHSVLMLGTSVGRGWFFRRFIRWEIVRPFTLGCLIGAPLGARIYLGLPEAVIALVVGLFMLAAVWMPPLPWRVPLRHPYFAVGVVHSFLSAMFSFGGVLQPLMMRTALDRMQVIATLAVALLFMNLAKIAGYVMFGFDYRPYLLLIGCALLAGVAGARVGRHLAERVPEGRFRRVFRILMTVLAARLLYRAWELGLA